MNESDTPHTGELYDAEGAAADALLAALPPGVDGYPLLGAYEVAMGDSWMAEMERVVEAIAAHLPGAAGLIRRAYWHVIESGRMDVTGGCCTEDR